MNKKSIRNFFAGVLALLVIIGVCYLIYLFGNWIIDSIYTKQYIYPFIINYMYPFVVGLIAVILLLVVCVAVIQILDESQER